MRITVENHDDPRLVPYRDLTQKNLVRQSGRFIAEGEKVVERLIASDLEVESVLAVPAFADRFEPLLPETTTVFVASPELLAATAGFDFHRGVLACGIRRPLDSLADFVSLPPVDSETESDSAPRTWVICPDVQDPTNLGAILRTCQGFGVDGVLLGGKCADPYSRRVLRVSMGGVFRLPILESKNLVADLTTLRDQRGCELVATVLDDQAELLENCALRPRRLALLFGSEGHGLPADCIAACSRKVTLTMCRAADSFNVAAAAAMFLYHFSRVARCS